MTDAVRLSDTVCRQGGDEFLILLSEIEHADDATTFSNKLLRSLINPHEINGKKISVHMSIGICIFPLGVEVKYQKISENKLCDVLIDNADKAMYQAKSRGHNCYQLFKKSIPLAQ
jgi:diguanylate cyclase (GGDEF)-like protein